MTDDAPFGSRHVHWHPTDQPDVLAAAIARVRALFGLTPETTIIASHVQTAPDAPQAAQNAPQESHTSRETLTPDSPRTSTYSASSFQCGAIRRAVDAQHDTEALLARFHRVTPQVVVTHKTPRVRREGIMCVDAPTVRQMQVLARIVAGDSQDEAADALGIARSTCNRHLVALRKRWGVSTTAGLIGRAVARGYLTIMEEAA